MNTAVAIPMTTLLTQGTSVQVDEGATSPFAQVAGQIRPEASVEAFKSFLNGYLQRLNEDGESLPIEDLEAMIETGVIPEGLDVLVRAAPMDLDRLKQRPADGALDQAQLKQMLADSSLADKQLKQMLADGALDVTQLKQMLADGSLDVTQLKQMLADGSLDVTRLGQMLADGTLDADELRALLAASTVPVVSPDGKTLPDVAQPGAEIKVDARSGNLLDGNVLMRLVELMETKGGTPPILHSEAKKAEDGQSFLLRARELAVLLSAAREEVLKPAENLFRQVSAVTTEQTGQTVPLVVAAESERSPQSQVQTPPQFLRMDVPPGRAGWDQALGNRVMWMLNQKTQSAELQLNPAHLGPVKVSISMEGERANVHFIAHHGITRDAIDAALPRLREMLAESGVNLGQVNVSSQGAGDPRGGPLAREAGNGGGQHRSSGEDESVESSPESVRISAKGLVDDYA